MTWTFFDSPFACICMNKSYLKKWHRKYTNEQAIYRRSYLMLWYALQSPPIKGLHSWLRFLSAPKFMNSSASFPPSQMKVCHFIRIECKCEFICKCFFILLLIGRNYNFWSVLSLRDDNMYNMCCTIFKFKNWDSKYSSNPILKLYCTSARWPLTAHEKYPLYADDPFESAYFKRSQNNTIMEDISSAFLLRWNEQTLISTSRSL